MDKSRAVSGSDGVCRFRQQSCVGASSSESNLGGGGYVNPDGKSILHFYFYNL